MPSRRQLLATFGAGVLAGCASADATAGTVARKRITVAVPQRVGDPVETSVALLAFEPDRGLVHGEYDPEYAGGAVDGATLSVLPELHDRLTDRFPVVQYGADVVPDDGETPANGVVGRRAFDTLSLGGTATVETYTGDDGYGRLRLLETSPREREPSTVTVGEFDLDERVEGT